MSIYYIETTDGQRYELDATTDISKTQSGKITDNPVESGDVLSDHYVHLPDSFTLSGKISSFKGLTAGSTKTPKDFIEGVSAIKRNKKQFKFFFGGKIKVSENCMFTNLKITQNKEAGHNRGGPDTFIIQAQIRQVDFAESAAIIVKRDEVFSDKFATEAESAKTTESTTIKELTGLDAANATAAEMDALWGEITTSKLRPPVTPVTPIGG